MFISPNGLFEQSLQTVPGGLAIFGAPYDGTTSFRPGTRGGPDAIRAVSIGLESYSPEQDKDLEDLAIQDFGNLDLPHGSAEPVIAMVRRAVNQLLTLGLRPVMLGGEHSLTAGAVEATIKRHPNLVVVQMDAHADLRPSYLGETYSHASAMRRCLDVLQPGHLLQVGIRSGTREEFTQMRRAHSLLPPTPEALSKALQPHAGKPLYLTLDLDIFDPSAMPGTGTPEPGGIQWADFARLLRVLPGPQIVAADIMELAPMLDPSACSSILAAKALREILLLLGPPTH